MNPSEFPSTSQLTINPCRREHTSACIHLYHELKESAHLLKPAKFHVISFWPCLARVLLCNRRFSMCNTRSGNNLVCSPMSRHVILKRASFKLIPWQHQEMIDCISLRTRSRGRGSTLSLFSWLLTLGLSASGVYTS